MNTNHNGTSSRTECTHRCLPVDHGQSPDAGSKSGYTNISEDPGPSQSYKPRNYVSLPKTAPHLLSGCIVDGGHATETIVAATAKSVPIRDPSMGPPLMSLVHKVFERHPRGHGKMVRAESRVTERPLVGLPVTCQLLWYPQRTPRAQLFRCEPDEVTCSAPHPRRVGFVPLGNGAFRLFSQSRESSFEKGFVSESMGSVVVGNRRFRAPPPLPTAPTNIFPGRPRHAIRQTHFCRAPRILPRITLECSHRRTHESLGPFSKGRRLTVTSR